MKRGLSGKTRRGAPPLPQQRRALRVVQLTLLGLSLFIGWLAVRGSSDLGELIALAMLGILALGGAFLMGFRLVRGPTPPEL